MAYAKSKGGIPPEFNLKALKQLGFNPIAFGGESYTEHAFDNGIPDFLYAKAVKFTTDGSLSI